jgi:zinc protease
MKKGKTEMASFEREFKNSKIVKSTLDNGLTVVMLKNDAAPVVAVDIWYKVGSRNEVPGRSGFAHLFEHMMFEGSENVGKAQHMQLISDVGGTVNGSTTQDRTNYWEVVPANQIELALWLEADRMRSLNISLENFENQRATVKEERRMRVDNQPYMRILYETKDELAYSNFAYKHSVIGSMEDLDNATVDDVRRFHDMYYRPNNAVLAIVGDLNIGNAAEVVQKYFGNISAGTAIPDVDLSEPPQQSAKRMEYQDPFAPFPAYLVSYHIPDRRHDDFYAVELLEKILFDGESSRFYRRLVEEKQLALHVFGGNDGKMGPALFYLFGQIRPGHSMKDMEDAVAAEFDSLMESGISDAEMEKAKNKVKTEFISQLETARAKADQLCMYATVFNEPERLFSDVERFLSVSAEDLQRAARTYFKPESRSIIEIYPKGRGEV